MLTMRDIAETAANAWLRAVKETPLPSFWDAFDRSTYRERLDRLSRNWHGEVIPRRVVVHNNIRALGRHRDPSRLPR